MFLGGQMAGRRASAVLNCLDAEALVRAVEAGEACHVGSHRTTPTGNGEQSVKDPLGHLYTTISIKFGSISWGSIPADLHRGSANCADDA